MPANSPVDTRQTEEDQSSNPVNSNSRKRILLFLTLATLVLSGAWWIRAHPEFLGQFLPDDRPQEVVAAQFRGSANSTFDLSNATVPREEIHSGGPPKDGIPALTDPKFITADQVNYLQPADRVIGVVIDAEARAYPLRILNYHEIVNDTLAETPIAVTYCPLCDSAAVFDRRTPLGEREFGVSGLLYNSNVLMYDRKGQPESLWSQVKTQGISGAGADKSLKALPLELTTWKAWSKRHPDTKVLSPETGHSRNYRRSPYGNYFRTPQLMFPVKPTSDRLPAKTPVLGVWTGNETRAYPISLFNTQRTRIEDQIDGKKLVLEFDPDANSVRVVEAEDGLSWLYSFWFAWYALHPDTEVAK